MNDFRRTWRQVEAEVLGSIQEVGRSGWYILGDQVSQFEQSLAAYCSTEFAVGVASGLDALEIALRASGCRPGMPVLTTPLSAFATTLAIIRSGGTPVYVDTDPSGLMDLDLAEEALREHPDIRHMVPVHLYGQALDLERLDRIAKEYDVRVIEDAAQAIGASSGKRKIGGSGVATALSFYPTKNLGALGDGGALLTNDPEVAKCARSLRDYGQTSKYKHDIVGMNSRLDEVHAAILKDVFLPRLAEWTDRRRASAAAYDTGIDNPAVARLPTPHGSQSAHHLYPVVVTRGHREALAQHLADHHIKTAVHYPIAIPDQGALTDWPYRTHGEMRNARRIAESELSLPMHPMLTETEVQRVVAAVNSWNAA